MAYGRIRIDSSLQINSLRISNAALASSGYLQQSTAVPRKLVTLSLCQLYVLFVLILAGVFQLFLWPYREFFVVVRVTKFGDEAQLVRSLVSEAEIDLAVRF